MTRRFVLHATACACLLALTSALVAEDDPLYICKPEQKRIFVRDPSALKRARIPASAPPRTVSDDEPECEELLLSLDDAIRIALQNSEVVRVLAGVGAASSGRTIYDPAITNTTIDQELGVFDPNLVFNNTFSQLETPAGLLDPFDPTRTILSGTTTEIYALDFELTKRFATGTQIGLKFDEDYTHIAPETRLINPQNAYSTEINLTQPLLQGGGIAANTAPVVIARIETERSYFQFKDSVQDLVQSVIEAYWNLVFARTDVWAREQQVEQSRFAFNLTEAQLDIGIANIGEAAQTRVAFANFRANLIAARANLLDAEAALRNLLGLPPNDEHVIVPTTAPTEELSEFDWDALVGLAEQRRPDIIELKLILEADQQQLIVAENQAQARLDAVALYRWNGLEGQIPNGDRIATGGDEYTDWTIGINFSVPLGLRAGRAALRQRELIIMRDRANLQQGVHAAIHSLATNLRLQANAYAQYEAFRETREAAELNIDRQFEAYRADVSNFLVVLQAITDWGNAVSSEARTLTDYNTALASLERETGTILETHGVRFYEERYRSLGPLGHCGDGECYPKSRRPNPNMPMYPDSGEPAENAFDLQPPAVRGRDGRDGGHSEPAELPQVPLDAEPPPAPPAEPGPQLEPAQPTSWFRPKWGLPRLLVPKRLDGIETARAAGGIEPEEHADER